MQGKEFKYKGAKQSLGQILFDKPAPAVINRTPDTLSDSNTKDESTPVYPSPLVHLLWSGQNTMWIIYFILFYFCVVHFHTALFAGESEIVYKTTCVLRSCIRWTEILNQKKAGRTKTG